jgi:lipopolysaccharide assembly protein B
VEFYLVWLQNHLLGVGALLVTAILIYHYVIERDSGVKLSKRYRNAIFEAQSKIFLNATQHLISGDKNLAIREFLNAVDLNRETVETYFALGGLFRSNGEIDKAIGIHRSLIARENVSETVRVQALHELAVDFDAGGFVEKAIETYQDVLKINPDQANVVQSLCRIYENIEDWDKAYNYRVMLSKISPGSQEETIAHILVQKAKQRLFQGEFAECDEELDDAFRHAPSVSAKILRLKLMLVRGEVESAKSQLVDILNEHSEFVSFLFLTLTEPFTADHQVKERYSVCLNLTREFFLTLDEKSIENSPSVVLSRIRLLKEMGRLEEAYNLLHEWMVSSRNINEGLQIEYIKLLLDLGKIDQALGSMGQMLESMKLSQTRHFCHQCGFNSDEIFWRCPQCYQWETIQFRWKV